MEIKVCIHFYSTLFLYSYLVASSHPHPQEFHPEDDYRYSHRGEACHGSGQETVHGGCLLVPWWQAAQRDCVTTRRACLESLLWGARPRPTHQAHDALLLVLDSMPETGQARKDCTCLHHFICFQCSCFLQLLIYAVLLHCMMLYSGWFDCVHAMLFSVVPIVCYVRFYSIFIDRHLICLVVFALSHFVRFDLFRVSMLMAVCIY